MGARAYRSPTAAGIQWAEVVRRVTRESPSGTVLDDIYPCRDGISESAACVRFGGSRDICTEVFVAPNNNIWSVTPPRDAEEQDEYIYRDHANPSRQRSEAIRAYRSRIICDANKEIGSPGLSGKRCSERTSNIRFCEVVIAFSADDDDATHGRMHAVPLVGSITRRLCTMRRCANHFAESCNRGRVSHSDCVFKDLGFSSDCARMFNSAPVVGNRARYLQSGPRGRPKPGRSTTASPPEGSWSDPDTCQRASAYAVMMSESTYVPDDIVAQVVVHGPAHCPRTGL